MRLGIRSKLFLVSVALIAVCVAVAFLFLDAATDRFLTQREEQHLRVRAAGVAHAASQAGLADRDLAGWDALADGLAATAEARVTILGRDGTVWGDSELAADQLARVENHAARAEVRAALERGTGSTTRHSTTLGHRMMYVAASFPAAAARPVGVVRLALPLTTVDEAVARMRWLLALAALLALGVAVGLSWLAAHWAGRSVRSATATARKLAAGDLTARTRSADTDEVGELARPRDPPLRPRRRLGDLRLLHRGGRRRGTLQPRRLHLQRGRQRPGPGHRHRRAGPRLLRLRLLRREPRQAQAAAGR